MVSVQWWQGVWLGLNLLSVVYVKWGRGGGRGAVPSSDGNNNLDTGGPALTTSSGGAGSMGNTGGCCVGMRGGRVFFILVS